MAFKLLIASVCLNALCWIILIPIWQYPDEQAHFAQVQNIAETGQSIFGVNTSREVVLSEEILKTKRDETGSNFYTYHPEFKLENSGMPFGKDERQLINLPKSERTNFVQNEATYNPPLYYYLASRTYKLASNLDIFYRVFAIRFMSVIIFLVNIFIIYKTAQILFRSNTFYGTCLASLVSFMPMLVFSSTGILPDPLTNLLYSLIVYFSIKVVITKKVLAHVVLSIPALTLGFFTRQHFLLGIIPIFSAAAFTLKGKNLFYLLVVGVVLLALIILASINPRLLPFLYLIRIPDARIIDLQSADPQSLFRHIILFSKNSAAQSWPWYWGVYKWLSYTLPPIYYQVINRLAVISALGLVFYLVQYLRKPNFLKNSKLILFALFVNIFYWSFFLIWDYFFRRNNNFSFGFQGRYFFPFITLQMYLLTFGLYYVIGSIFKKKAALLIFLLTLCMLLFNDLTLFHLSATYYDTDSLSSFVMHASQYKPQILKGNIIVVVIFLSMLSQLVFLTALFKIRKLKK